MISQFIHGDTVLIHGLFHTNFDVNLFQWVPKQLLKL